MSHFYSPCILVSTFQVFFTKKFNHMNVTLSFYSCSDQNLWQLGNSTYWLSQLYYSLSPLAPLFFFCLKHSLMCSEGHCFLFTAFLFLVCVCKGLPTSQASWRQLFPFNHRFTITARERRPCSRGGLPVLKAAPFAQAGWLFSCTVAHLVRTARAASHLYITHISPLFSRNKIWEIGVKVLVWIE